MESEIGRLKRELARTKEALRAARKKCRILATRLDEKTVDRESEAVLRDQQLSRILRALLVLESKLVWEQKLIGRLLSEKDDLIREQRNEMDEWRRNQATSAPCSLEPIYQNKTRTIDQEKDIIEKTVPDKLEETNVNWYSDPDEDNKSNDDPFGHGISLFNGNRNSVLECVNQILLRDMEDDRERDSTIPKEFKHRGRVVRFQAARLSDIESVGSEMERKNSQDEELRVEEPTRKSGVFILNKTNLDYEDIESLSTPLHTPPPTLHPRPQFQNNTLILKKIPSPSFLIDESRKRNESKNIRKTLPNNLLVRPLEEFRIEEQTGDNKKDKSLEIDDIRTNFEEFNLDECDLFKDNEQTDRLEFRMIREVTIYDHFLEATGLSNKSILTPSRLLSNHKSALKPKDVKYKNKVKATAGISEKFETHSSGTTRVKRWTGPFV